MIDRCAIHDSSTGQTGNKLVGVTNTLSRTKRIAGAIAIIFTKGLIIIIIAPFWTFKEVTKRRNGTGRGGNGVKWTEIHHRDGICGTDICSWKIVIETLGDGGKESIEKGLLCVCAGDGVGREGLECGAETMVQSEKFRCEFGKGGKLTYCWIPWFH